MNELLYLLIGAILGVAAFLITKDQLEAKRERDAERRKNSARLILAQFNKTTKLK